MAPEVADLVIGEPELYPDLYEGLHVQDDVMRGRTADALERISRNRPDLLLNHFDELIQMAEKDPLPMVRWHLAMIFGNLAVYEEKVNDIVFALAKLVMDERVFVKSWAISSLAIVGRLYPERRQRILELVEPRNRDQSVAIRSRAQKAMRLLVNDEESFPGGWVKSDNLKGL